jgi:hypothetical protein
MSEPLFKHVCSACTYLGAFKGQDLYYCPQGGGTIPTIISRYGDGGPDYTSGLYFAEHNVYIGEGLVRARKLGLLPEPSDESPPQKTKLDKSTVIIGVRRKDVSCVGCIGDWEDFQGTVEDVINDCGRSNITHIKTQEAEYAIPEVEAPPEYLTVGDSIRSVWAGDAVEGKLVKIVPCMKFGYYNAYILEKGGEEAVCVPAETCTVVRDPSAVTKQTELDALTLAEANGAVYAGSNQPPKNLTLDERARLSKVHHSTISALIKRGLLVKSFGPEGGVAGKLP